MARDALLDMYLKDVSVYQVLTREQEVTLALRLRGGDQQARQELIQCNLRLVLSVARQYDNQGMPLLDVIEEGNIGLMRAVVRFNPDLECRFSTYAVHWIKQAIRRALLEKVKNIRVPAYMAELVARYKKFSRDNPHVTSIAEISKALRLPTENAKLVARIQRTSLINAANLDTQEVSDLSSYFEDDHIDADPEAMVGNAEDVAFLQGRLNQLPEREAEVLRYRYGMDDFPVMTLEEIGKVFGLTRERVRQIEAKAIKRLRELIPAENVL